jgi:hypothetical protein
LTFNVTTIILMAVTLIGIKTWYKPGKAGGWRLGNEVL